MGTLPFFWSTIRAPIRRLGPHEKRVKAYPDTPKTLGEHLRKRRLDLGQTQEQLASRFGVTFVSYNGWEAGRIAPKIIKWPEMIQFLGYDPTPPPNNLDQVLTSIQRRNGIQREELAKRLGIERKTLFNWLAGKTVPSAKTQKKLLQANLPGAELLTDFKGLYFVAEKSALL